MTEEDLWQWWATALAFPQKIGTAELPIYTEPRHGFFRVRPKDGQWQAVQIWRDEFGIWQAMRAGRHVDPGKVSDLWLWACRNPISEDAYDMAMAGNGFSDEPPRAATIGDNIREADPHDALMIEYLGEKEAAEEVLREPIADKDAADRAAIWAHRLIDISNKAKNHHKVEKQPSLDEGRRITDRWRELMDEPHALGVRLKRHSDAWLIEQDRLEKERAWRAEQEAAALRREAQEAAERADESGDPAAQAEAGQIVAEAQAAAREAEFRRPQSGRTNAKVSLRTFYSGEITDYDTFLMAIKDRDEVKQMAKTIADRMGRARIEMPGMKIVTEQRAV